MSLIQKYPRTCIGAAGIFLLCAWPGNQLPNIEELNHWSIDKWVHAFMFFIWTHLWMKEGGKKWMVLFGTILFGIFMELGQTYIFYLRFGEWTDVLANSTGTILRIMIPVHLLFKSF